MVARLGLLRQMRKPELGGVPGLSEDAWTRLCLAFVLGSASRCLGHSRSAYSLGGCTGPLTDVATSELSGGSQRKGLAQQNRRQAAQATQNTRSGQVHQAQPWPKT